MKILFMGSYPPRQCGIATFTQDIATSIKKKFNPKTNIGIIAMDHDEVNIEKYPEEVVFQVNETSIRDYARAARKINKDDSIGIVNIQHEFGIFGGKYLNYLTAFLETITKPVVITLHSVSPNPDENIKSTIKYLSVKAVKLVVMAESAVKILSEDYGIPKEKITMIPHGIHDVQYEPSMIQKKKLGYGDKMLLVSFGLISGSKKYEDIINALPDVVKEHPNVLYLIVGATHPLVLKYEGEKYRNSLKRLIKKLGLEKNVQFVNKYLGLEELLEYLKAADISISSGRGLSQITSGTLVYGMGCGRPFITIPFEHAREIITPERGILAELGNPESFKKAILKLLSDKELRESMGENAYKFTRHMTWPSVAESYMDIFREYL
jgi:glycosyltransferase involved in cell wall biosynthesis